MPCHQQIVEIPVCPEVQELGHVTAAQVGIHENT